MVITYVAQNRIISGHSASTSYDIEIGISQADLMGNIFSVAHESLSGKREVVKQPREDDEWTITTNNIVTADLENYEEFFYSVIDGTSFQIDLYGTIAVPDNVQDVVMISKKYTPVRKGTSDYFTLSFVFRVNV